MIGGIAQRWRLLSGHNNWTNLLKPLDSDLQRYLLHYGGMAQATNDAFDFDILSKYIGYSKFSRKHLFERCGLVKGNPFRYKAVKYIYATSGPGISLPESFILKPLSEKTWYKESNWMGYIAVATDEGKAALGRRDILIAWRGTIMPIEWEKDFEFPLVPASKILGKCGGSNAHVHQGFLSIYTATNPRSKYSKTSARDQVLSELKKLIEQYKHEELSITLTGHSLGGALSTLCATDIVCNGYNKICHNPYKTCPVTAFRYGAPMVGDSNFKHTAESMNDLHMLSIHNVPDIVPKSPAMPGYTRVGQEHFVDSKKSPYLTFPGDTYTWHNLEGAYLHSLAIENGGEPKRDLALVNKGSGALKPKYGIPFSWWCEENKGMVQKSDGSWQLRDYEGDE
ncbi:phospholipase A1-IIgamma-like [Sesamum indicum]|uniref:Phospholipase A1 n=1 Tax=Sesamum indicum TaxID=4182 RepID=A0A6I9UFX3_SESIN|nr:phospholipase A1-IIgamma-like [Sesamum indicum]